MNTEKPLPDPVREALELALRLVEAARPRFPKSIHHADRFLLEQACAAIRRAQS